MSLGDLRQAIEKYDAANSDPRLVDTPYLIECRANAWRAAFEWMNRGYTRHMKPTEYSEGLALIREKLR